MGGMDWIDLAQNRGREQALVNSIYAYFNTLTPM